MFNKLIRISKTKLQSSICAVSLVKLILDGFDNLRSSTLPNNDALKNMMTSLAPKKLLYGILPKLKRIFHRINLFNSILNFITSKGHFSVTKQRNYDKVLPSQSATFSPHHSTKYFLTCEVPHTNSDSKSSPSYDDKPKQLCYGTALIDLIERLTMRDVTKMQNAINFPSGLSEECSTPEEFLLSIDTWEDYNPELFFIALSHVRNDLVYFAKDIPFLTDNLPPIEENDENRQRMRKFITLLRNEITINKWRIILKNRGYTIDANVDYSEIWKFCLDKNIITKDLKTLTECFENIKRMDIAQHKLLTFKSYFSEMTAQDFLVIFKDVAFEGRERETSSNDSKIKVSLNLLLFILVYNLKRTMDRIVNYFCRYIF